MSEASQAEGRAVPVTAETAARQQLVRLVFAHLSLTVLSFGIAIALDSLGRELPPGARQGLYWTVAAAFGTTVVSALLLGRARLLWPFVSVQIATDVAIVTSLVHYSGGRESIFTFLYVVVTLYGAVLFERRGAMIGASLSAAAYGALLLLTRVGWIDGWGEEGGDPLPVGALAAIWAVHVGALYLVGVLASLLSTELQRTGRALDQSTSDLRRLRDLHQRTVESLLSGLLTLDAEARITSFNPEAERITGQIAVAVLGRSLEAVIPGALELVRGGTPTRDRPSAPRTRLRYRNARNDELYLGVAASVLRGADGQPDGHVVIFQDVTEVVAMEQELRRTERLAAVGEMAAKIAHEIRNPLASISGSIQILQSGAAPAPASGTGAEGRRLMDIVVRETDRLNALITDFLVYSRPTPPDIKAVPARSILAEVVELLEGVRPADVEIVLSAPASLLVLADPAQLRQVVWNLATNGLEAMSGTGRLELGVRAGRRQRPQAGAGFRRKGAEAHTREEAPWVQITVSDTGHGMSAEVRERLFEPFFTTKREGTGLGLATVYRIAESHGGSVEIESQVGVGTRIGIWLPGVEEAE